MTDMLRGWLLGCTHTDHNVLTLSLALRICPPPPVTQKLSNPSWKVIVSASRGQCLEPGSSEPGFLFWRKPFTSPAPARSLDSFIPPNHHLQMTVSLCRIALSKKAPLPGSGDRRAR